MNDVLTLFKYPGSKRRHFPVLNPLIDTKKTLLIEPFLGSGVVLLNSNITNKIGNDLDKNIIKIWNSIKGLSFQEFKSFFDEAQKKFPNYGIDKDQYYKFRSYGNSMWFNTNSKEEGLFYLLVGNSCINSLLRFGPNGFNQGWGNRGNDLRFSETNWSQIQKSIENTNFTNYDYRILFDKYGKNKDVFWFLDPPYQETPVDYNRGFNRKVFLDEIKRLNSKVLYTDIYHDDIIEQLGDGWGYKKMRDMVKISPGKGAGTKTGDEVVFYNFKHTNKLF